MYNRQLHAVGCIFPEVWENRDRFATDEELFRALVDAIDEAQKGKIVPVPQLKKGDENFDFHAKEVATKRNLLAMGCNIMVTLTKHHARCWGHQQLRVWVKSPHLWHDGSHADGYGYGAIFEAYGSLERIVYLVEKILFPVGTGGHRRFEDEKYIIWI